MKMLFKFRIFLTAMIGMGIILSLTTCKKDEDHKATLPILDTKIPATITSNSAVVGGFISSDGGATITERGVCFSSVNQNPSVSDIVITGGNGTGNYLCTLPDLDSETTYFVRAYALNSAGIGYGNPDSFTTAMMAPIADFTATPDIGTRPLSVSFTDQSANNPGSWHWDFGDGGNSTEQNPAHTYIQVGTYTVQLTVTNNAGSEIEEKISFIHVTDSSGQLTDIDGNVYKTVEIGLQEWMAENLKVTHYRNGDDIPIVYDFGEWGDLSTGAYCWFQNDISWKDLYGALYNWYAVVDSRELCPAGWHIPSKYEWTTLTNFLGGADIAGVKMKSTRMEPDAHPRWDSNNSPSATNSSGFSGLPGGYRTDEWYFAYLGAVGAFWSCSEYTPDYNAWISSLNLDYSSVGSHIYDNEYGFSVRCLRD